MHFACADVNSMVAKTSSHLTGRSGDEYSKYSSLKRSEISRQHVLLTKWHILVREA